MFIKRKLYNKLLDWKQKASGRRALMIEGARRVGKSTLVEEFARQEYRSYILIDFNKASKRVRESFDLLDHPDRFFQVLTMEYQTRLYQRESLIIFDEIQKFPRAREAIKYLVADGRYDYIETGSLISIRENVEEITIPSEERKLKMYPLDFEEFLEASGESLLYEHITECFHQQMPLERPDHNNAMWLFKEYLLVGGMPQAVRSFIENGRDFACADEEKRDILALYRDDIKKSAKRYRSRVSAIFENIPSYLSAHEKKVVLREVEDNATFDRYDEPIFWLGDSMICNLCYKCNDPNVGFSLNRNESYVKCYMGDTGLLVSLAFSGNDLLQQGLYQAIMKEKLSINKGMLYENMIAQMIAASGTDLYFYTRYAEEKHRNDIEIDFLLSNESNSRFKIMPIEVKSAKNYTTTSLGKFAEIYRKRISQSYIIHPKLFVKDNTVIRIPPYMLPAMLSK